MTFIGSEVCEKCFAQYNFASPNTRKKNSRCSAGEFPLVASQMALQQRNHVSAFLILKATRVNLVNCKYLLFSMFRMRI
jgi:hypothetical protein